MTDALRAFWQARLTAAMARAALYEEAISALTEGGVQMYRLSTGQTDQMVTRADLSKLETWLQATLNLIATLNARLNCGGSTHVVPGF